jgi:cytoplasmic FMR1 interacting protein
MSDALSNVEVLYELPLIDSQPSVEGANNAIVYEANFDTNFEDKTAYITGISKYIEEAVLHSNLVNTFFYENENIFLFLFRTFFSNKVINMQ